MNVVYVVEAYIEILGYKLYPHTQIMFSTYEGAKHEVDILERQLHKRGYIKHSTTEEIRADKPFIDSYLEHCWKTVPFFSQKIIIDTWAVL